MGDMATSAANGDGAARKLADGLGWFSLGLGTTQLLAPGEVNRLIGIRDDAHTRFWQRVVGIQELSAAAGILGVRRMREWLWGRTAGDVVHLTMLGRAFRGRCEHPGRLAGATVSVLGTFGADAYAAVRLTTRPSRGEESMKAFASITVNAPRDSLQRAWQEFQQGSDGSSRIGPIEVVAQDPGRSTEWRTAEQARIKASGVTRFTDAPADRGAEIHIQLSYDVPAGAVGAVVEKVKGDDPHQRVQDDLRRFKQLIETGEIARSDGAPTGHSARMQPKQRAAQPPEHAHV
jgi:uncharacterized membrane protein